MTVKMVKVEKTCNMCEQTFTFEVDEVGFELWRAGHGHIQDLLPTLAVGFRELLISETCSDCFDSIMVDDEEYEYEDEHYAYEYDSDSDLWDDM